MEFLEFVPEALWILSDLLLEVPNARDRCLVERQRRPRQRENGNVVSSAIANALKRLSFDSGCNSGVSIILNRSKDYNGRSSVCT